jgi:hypothetical protein
MLASSVNTVVTTCTVSSDIHMIEIGRSPGIGRMTIVTGIAAREVGRVLAGCRHSVVTRITGANDLYVIDRVHRRKDVGIVAVFTNIARLDVGRILACRIHSIVAVDAISNDVQMVEIGR